MGAKGVAMGRCCGMEPRPVLIHSVRDQYSQADQNNLRMEVVLQICNLNSWEAEAGG